MAMERRFLCTACGACCRGQVPLTLDESLKYAHIFPLAMVWTPVRPGGKAHDLALRLGVGVRLGGKKDAGVFVTPAAYLPKTMPCPALDDDGLLCRIHADKPLRCRSMPFYPYREEDDQGDLLIPRPGWKCDVTSERAPVAYSDRKIVDKADFSAETAALTAQTPAIRAYAKHVLTYVPGVAEQLAKAAGGKFAGHVVMSYYFYLSRLKNDVAVPVAAAQTATLTRFIEQTEGRADLAEHHRNYVRWRGEMQRFL
jgi:Fe-S-cluster containining protein